MSTWVSRVLDQNPTPSGERRFNAIRGLLLALAGLVFILVSTLVVAYDAIIPGRSNIASLQVGDIAPQDIRAPFDWRYESAVLTERQRQAAMDSTAPVYDPPDPNVARQQVQLARQILDYIDNIRRDPFGTLEQHIEDIEHISALTLDRRTIETLLSLSDESWRALDAEIISVLERVMRQEIREANLDVVRSQLPMQVSVRFNENEARTIVAIVEDLLRPNTFPNPAATEAARQAAAANTPPETRAFERGQIVVREGARIEPVDYEALAQLGLLQTADRRLLDIARAFFASLLVLVVVALYLTRFRPSLFDDLPMLFLLEALLLIILVGARIFSGNDQIYIYPTAALALMFVALEGPQIAIIGVIALAVLVGLMANKSLEIGVLVLLGGLFASLTLRREERLNNFFISGLVVACSNIIVVSVFNLEMLDVGEGDNLGLLLLYSAVNGGFAAAVALAGMYAVTLLFNLPTSIKLMELSQPNQPLLQRLLREAPGTYQHSLQVGNLSEQAANAIGANSELVRVAALYHDIGKMLNPAFFIENQADNVNPHDVLRDPYRSADIIISHVTDGERLGRQYKLPARVRDFILEHHGTTLVAYFYRAALEQAEDPESVDIDQFTYPGPKPRSRESAIMMLADSCESTVRARKPTNKQEIADIVQQIIDARMRDGQLDDSGMTTNDIRTVRSIFIEMLQAVFHPRIDYPTIPAPVDGQPEIAAEVAADELLDANMPVRGEAARYPEPPLNDEGGGVSVSQTSELPVVHVEDDEPLPEVPPLRRTGLSAETGGGEDGALSAGDSRREPAEDKAERD
ncbi:MAG: HDIG domain-containing protein [Chloroflexota bacterium]|nr:MAG: hypothetical protein DIU68_08860 [Chloroflexota bacterium]